MAIATDRVDREHIERAQRWDVGEVRRFMLVFGLVSTAFDLLTFGVLLHYFHASETIFQTAWFVVSLLTELAVLLVLRTRLPAWRSRPGALLLATTLAVGVLAVTLPLVGPAARVFGFVPLPWGISAALAAIVAGYVLCTEAVKLHLPPASKRRAARARTRA
jgi:Mg2+-importing ATPase